MNNFIIIITIIVININQTEKCINFKNNNHNNVKTLKIKIKRNPFKTRNINAYNAYNFAFLNLKII